MFWDGTRWVVEPTTRIVRRRDDARLRPLTSIAVGIVSVAAIVLQLVPLAATRAASPTLTVSPGSAAVGTKVTVSGSGFPARSSVQIEFDGSTGGLPSAGVRGNGTFSASMTVPQAASGTHTLEAAALVTTKGGKTTSVGSVLATATLTVTPVTTTSPVPSSTATPTATPVASSTPSPSTTAAPTPTPQPTAAPTATASPTPAPSSSVAPTLAAPSGYVTRSGQRLLLNGSPFRMVGLNIGTGVCGNTASLTYALDSIGSGQTTFRFWFLQQFATRYGVRDWTTLDAVVAAARARGLKIVATLGNEWADCEGPGGFKKTESWFATGYRSSVQPNGTKTYRDWVAEVVARYRDDPAIAIWQFMNEPQADTNGTCSSTADDTLKAFAEDIGGLVKSIDHNHLTNLGSIGDGNCGLAGSQYQTVQSSSNLDVLEIHQYHPWAYSGDQWNGTKVRISQAAALNKPLFNGEDGILLGTEAATVDERAADFDAKLYAHLDQDAMVGELLWTWNNGRTPITGLDIGAGDPVFDVLRKY